jgi:hypothetical protein
MVMVDVVVVVVLLLMQISWEPAPWHGEQGEVQLLAHLMEGCCLHLAHPSPELDSWHLRLVYLMMSPVCCDWWADTTEGQERAALLAAPLHAVLYHHLSLAGFPNQACLVPKLILYMGYHFVGQTWMVKQQLLAQPWCCLLG